MSMTRNAAWSGLLGLVLALSACQPGVKVVVRDKATDEAAIRHVLAEVSRTFDAGDYEGMFALYREDVIVSATGAPDVVGRAAWREGLKQLPPGVKLQLRFDTKEVEIDGDLAYERGTFVVSMPDPATGKLQSLFDGRHVHIFRREADGSWKGWRLFEIQDKALPRPASPPDETHR
ncbi:MAG TPA: nuclear transport factor 2 family protein [Steroidobacteraceae bacterium]|nr:nuclear transport factor 2 family protein [Steroidobacteraceae bacterium]